MKKIIIGIILVICLSTMQDLEAGAKIIPDEAIRLRILANSNSNYDQQIKGKVKDVLQNDMYSLLSNTTKIDEARTVIKDNILSFDNSVKKVLTENNYNLGYAINYGTNYFPKKEYKGITYDEGYYESVLVTLGEGKGDNWWCILFPPLCLLEAEESTDVEYKFFVQELIEKFFGKH